ncbi:MAG TPA: hypothetical protein VK864_20640 [Longimicrobiales bacterium]|nr:hypothetical protein [Longimicrobiales bacterium]
MTHSAEVLAIRDALAQRFPNAQPVIYRTAGAISTGHAALDALLPGGGLPRGRLTLWEVGGGASALLRGACAAVVMRGERSAWVDAQRVTTGDGWVKGPLLLRPENELNALSCAEELMRCGGFALVVLSGVGGALEREAVRLSRAVKEGGGAFVVLAPQVPVAHLRVNSRIRPESYKWKLNPFGEPAHIESVRIRIEASAMGWSGHTELTLAVHAHAQRAAADPLLRDRRGAKKRTSNISKDKCERR